VLALLIRMSTDPARAAACPTSLPHNRIDALFVADIRDNSVGDTAGSSDVFDGLIELCLIASITRYLLAHTSASYAPRDGLPLNLIMYHRNGIGYL
jgi:hypothetical protein